MEIKKITRKNYKEAKKILENSFPKNELLPPLLLYIISKRKNIEYKGYYDNETFIGISYIIKSKKEVYILYLAVNNKIQSKGYGTKILTQIKENNQDKELILDIEPLDKTANNYTQRQKRYKFYQKNGFYNTQNYLIEDINYLILSTNKNFKKETLQKLIKKNLFYTPKIEKIKIDKKNIV